jgi:hypothetical protein
MLCNARVQFIVSLLRRSDLVATKQQRALSKNFARVDEMPPKATMPCSQVSCSCSLVQEEDKGINCKDLPLMLHASH